MMDRASVRDSFDSSFGLHRFEGAAESAGKPGKNGIHAYICANTKGNYHDFLHSPPFRRPFAATIQTHRCNTAYNHVG